MRGRPPPYNRSMTAFTDEGDASAGASHEDGWAATLRDGYAGRSVLVTGHTGFKGSWLTLWLHELGANVTGFALDPPTDQATSSIQTSLPYCARTCAATSGTGPPSSGRSDEPTGRHPPPGGAECRPRRLRGTDGDVLRECPGNSSSARRNAGGGPACAVVVVTSDKCYLNDESGRPFEEDDPLGGHDPYSASKAGTELVVNAYRDSFFPPSHVDDHGVAIATARAGNVIGGGDWTASAVVPDIVRSIDAGRPVRLRESGCDPTMAARLEPLGGYLTLAAHLRGPDRASFCRAWNFGPDATEEAAVRQLTERLLAAWGVGSMGGRQPTRRPARSGRPPTVDPPSDRMSWAGIHAGGWRRRWITPLVGISDTRRASSAARTACTSDIASYMAGAGVERRESCRARAPHDPVPRGSRGPSMRRGPGAWPSVRREPGQGAPALSSSGQQMRHAVSLRKVERESRRNARQTRALRDRQRSSASRPWLAATCRSGSHCAHRTRTGCKRPTGRSETIADCY